MEGKIRRSKKNLRAFVLSSFPGCQGLFQRSWVLKSGIAIILLMVDLRWACLFRWKRNAKITSFGLFDSSPLKTILVPNHSTTMAANHAMEHLWGFKTTIPQRTTGSSWLCEILCPRHGTQKSKHDMHVVWKVFCCRIWQVPLKSFQW